MYCDCIDRVKRYNFTACSPEHQPAMKLVESALKEVTRQLVIKAMRKLLRQVVDDEIVLSEEIIS